MKPQYGSRFRIINVHANLAIAERNCHFLLMRAPKIKGGNIIMQIDAVQNT